MGRSSLSKSVAIAPVLLVAACASQPRDINNICSVFDQKDGWVSSWQSAAKSTERRYGIPQATLLATVRMESGFKGNAKPPRRKLLGFIPWKRASSAYGYSQALDGTWAQYVAETNSFTARRNNFADALDFVGWYHSKTVSTYGVDPGDTYRLYMAYHEGWTAFGKGSAPASVQSYAQKTDDMARTYAAQLNQCR